MDLCESFLPTYPARTNPFSLAPRFLREQELPFRSPDVDALLLLNRSGNYLLICFTKRLESSKKLPNASVTVSCFLSLIGQSTHIKLQLCHDLIPRCTKVCLNFTRLRERSNGCRSATGAEGNLHEDGHCFRETFSHLVPLSA